jgi:hypothetical protein
MSQVKAKGKILLWLPVSPCVWMPVLVKDGNHFDTSRCNGEINGKGESLEQSAPDSGIDFGELKRIQPDTKQDVINLIEKTNP